MINALIMPYMLLFIATIIFGLISPIVLMKKGNKYYLILSIFTLILSVILYMLLVSPNFWEWIINYLGESTLAILVFTVAYGAPIWIPAILIFFLARKNDITIRNQQMLAIALGVVLTFLVDTIYWFAAVFLDILAMPFSNFSLTIPTGSVP
jgi:hypothetical protein